MITVVNKLEIHEVKLSVDNMYMRCLPAARNVRLSEVRVHEQLVGLVEHACFL